MLSRLRKLFGDASTDPANDQPKSVSSTNRPENTEELLSAALTFQCAGDLPAAEDVLRRILTLAPAHPQATHHLGIVLAQRGNHLQAEPFLRSATLLDPRNPTCFINLGNALRSQGRNTEASEAYRTSLDIEPTVDAYLRLGDVLQEDGQIDGVRESYQHALDICPTGLADAWNGLACLEKTLGHPEESIRLAKLALSCDPLHFHAHNNIGLALHALGEIEAAIDHFHLALSRNSAYAEAYNNLGNALTDLGHLEHALAAYETALKIRPDYHDAQWNRSLALLKNGDFEHGWIAYEDRFRRRGGEANRRNFRQPAWAGEDLRGKTILLHAEQGFGDALQFVRYAPLVAALGGTTYLEVHPELHRLLGTLSGFADIISRGAPLPAFDVHCSLMSLPHRLNTRLETIPAEIPYLHAPEEMSQTWGERMADDRNLRVGLVWSSNVLNKAIHASKSLPLRILRGLAGYAGISLYSLQKGDGRKEIATGGLSLIDWSDELKDFCDTAALIANLDLVISVDTAVAHLAGALGKPVWMLLWYGGDWRWLNSRDDSPWYPTMRLFRQREVGDWEAPVTNLCEALVTATRQFSETGYFTNPAPLFLEHTMPDMTAAEAAKNQGNVAYGHGELDQAAQYYRQAIAIKTDYAEAHNNLALVLRAQKHYEEAEIHLLRALDINQELPNAWFNLGCLFVDTQRIKDATTQFRKALALNPENFDAHIELGNLLGKQGLIDEAEQHMYKALAIDPRSAEAHGNLASVFMARGDLQQAETHARQSIAIDPEFADGHNILGAILQDSGHPDAAIVELRQAVALDAALQTAQYNLALCLLLNGDYANGFRFHESRGAAQRQAGMLRAEYDAQIRIIAHIPPWQGEALTNRHLLVCQEQGFGDLLMMLRYLPLLLEQGVASITLRCRPARSFERLVKAMPSGEHMSIIDLLAPAREYADFHCADMSLPYHMSTRLNTIPRNIPYLAIPSEIAEPWKRRLAALPGLKVGVVWSGNRLHTKDVQRSIPFAQLAPLLSTPGVAFVSLQKGVAAPSPLHDWMDECADFLDTAALIDNLDLVIAVDTAVAHLAGALGKPVWLLNRLNTDWRWGIQREDSPWYPTMRIFRQRTLGDWDEPLQYLRAALDTAVCEFASTGRLIQPESTEGMP